MALRGISAVVAFVGLGGLGVVLFGFDVALLLLIAITIHELGHYMALRCYGLRARIFVCPVFGATWIVHDTTPPARDEAGLCDDGDGAAGRCDAIDPLTAVQRAVMLLSGALFSIGVAVLLWPLIPLVEAHAWGLALNLECLQFVLLFVSLLNLCIPLPILDGPRVMALLGRTLSPTCTNLLAAAGLVIAIPMTWRMSAWLALPPLVLSCLYLCSLFLVPVPAAVPMTGRQRVAIGGLLLLAIATAGGMLVWDMPLGTIMELFAL